MQSPFSVLLRLPFKHHRECTPSPDASPGSEPLRIVGFAAGGAETSCEAAECSCAAEQRQQQRCDVTTVASGPLGSMVSGALLSRTQEEEEEAATAAAAAAATEREADEMAEDEPEQQEPPTPSMAVPISSLPNRGATSCLSLSRLPHSASMVIPRMRKASTCPSGLDEELIAAALGVQAATATPTTYQGSPLSSDSFDSQGMSSLGTTGRAQLTDSLTRRLFDAQADAATAHAQVQCLQEALLEERDRVEELQARLECVMLERDELLHEAAAALAAHCKRSRAAKARSSSRTGSGSSLSSQHHLKPRVEPELVGASGEMEGIAESEEPSLSTFTARR